MRTAREYSTIKRRILRRVNRHVGPFIGLFKISVLQLAAHLIITYRFFWEQIGWSPRIYGEESPNSVEQDAS